MIRITGKSGVALNIPDSWDELTRDQYVAVAGNVLNLVEGKMDLIDFRLNLLQSLTGYERSRKRYNAIEQEQINENLFMLAERLRFPIRPKYETPEVLEVLSEGLREKLKTHFPFEIFDKKYTDELKMVENLLKYSAAINFTMHRELLDVIELPADEFSSKKTLLWGPSIDIDPNGLVATDLVAGEFVDAYEYYGLYQRTLSPDYLDKLCLTLFRTDRKVYDSVKVALAKKFAVNRNIKYGVFLFFQNLMEYLVNSPVYGMLFNRKTEKSGEISIGMVGTIYSLSQEGYGSKEEISQWNLSDYMNAMLKQLIDAVKQLRGFSKTDLEIAKEFGLPIETIRKI
jgi:hypothetical protein